MEWTLRYTITIIIILPWCVKPKFVVIFITCFAMIYPRIIVGPLSTEFPVDRMAFGQSWPKT